MKYGKVEITGGFLLLMAWMNYLDRENLLPAACLACLLHEAGHYIVLRALGCQVAGLRLSAAGAEMILGSSLSYWQEILSAGAGPVINLALYCIFSGTGHSTFAGLNLVLAIFNLIPAAQLDGGRIFLCILSTLFGPFRADTIKFISDRLLILVLLILGTALFLYCGNSSMLMVALWLFLGLSVGKKEELGLAIRNRNG